VNVLIADDHIGVRSAISRVLKEEIKDLVIVEAKNLGELFVSSFHEQPHLVFLDWELSGLPSAVMLSLPADDPKRRRSEQRRNVVLVSLRNLTSQPSIVVLSSHPEARQAALIGGADAFILKGGPPHELFETLHCFTVLDHRK
jgi:DNA-binding NarL/FixJ family response regulator